MTLWIILFIFSGSKLILFVENFSKIFFVFIWSISTLSSVLILQSHLGVGRGGGRSEHYPACTLSFIVMYPGSRGDRGIGGIRGG